MSRCQHSDYLYHSRLSVVLIFLEEMFVLRLKAMKFGGLMVLWVLLLTSEWACENPYKVQDNAKLDASSDSSWSPNGMQNEPSPLSVKVAPLISTRFENLDHLKTVVSLRYENKLSVSDSVYTVHLKFNDRGIQVHHSLSSGLKQGELLPIQHAEFSSKMKFARLHPYVVRHRKELEVAQLLSRRRADIFGSKDVAFYDLAEASFRRISTPELAFIRSRDSSEKGFINTFNHVTAQAILTSFFTEELADLIGDLHERQYMPELTTGLFKETVLEDTINNPVDNYVDIINNEIGQMLGKELKSKYQIRRETHVTPELLAAYLNDLHAYYMRALHIGLEPYRTIDPVVIKFSKKLNKLLQKL